MNDQKQKIEVLACLGFALTRDQETNGIIIPDTLRDRLDYFAIIGNPLLKKPLSSVLIMNGRGKVDLEAQVMNDYLVQNKQFPAGIIFVEKYSMNTVENFLFSLYELWKKYEIGGDQQKNDQSGFTIEYQAITSDFHIKRAQYIANECHKRIAPIFRKNTLETIKIIGRIDPNTPALEEHAILWEKADEKIQRLFAFKFDMQKFCDEREFPTGEDRQLLQEFANQITNINSNQSIQQINE